MYIQLSLKEKDVKLVLLNGENGVDERQWTDENNLLEKFFPFLDEVLKKNSLDISDIEKFVLESNVPSGYTTARIARTIVKTLNFAQNS